MQRAFTEKKSRKKYAIKHAIDQVLRKTRKYQENMLSTKKRASFKKESKKSV